MKKTIALLLALLLSFGALSGCARTDAPAAAGQNVSAAPQTPDALPYTAENEIFTYEPVKADKTQLVVSRTGNIEVESFCRAFEERNPDVQVLYLDITGGNSSYKPAIDWVREGYAPDIMISAANFFDAESTVKYFENLSADPILQNYETAALQRTATNANIYWLPGPSSVSALIYNKTLFEQYGWAVPRSFDEFVALCLQIREDSNGEIDPWNPNAKYDNELLTVLEGMVYGELFAGMENRAWYNGVLAGTESVSEHMAPFYTMLQTLVDNGLLREEHFSFSATTRGKDFAAGKIAMINHSIFAQNSDEYEFGYMPFPSTDGELGYICDSYSCFVGLPVKERSEATSDAVRRFLEFFSSAEGQQIYIGKAMLVSNVKGVTLEGAGELAALQEVIDAGHMCARPAFDRPDGMTVFYPYQNAKEIASGERTAAECLAAIDAPSAPAAQEAAQSAPEVVANAPKNMTVLETSFYIADAYRETMDAQIGLIANNTAFRGNLMRVFAGDLLPAFLTVLKPRSFGNGSALVKVTMSGEQLLAALNAPPDYDGKLADCVYAYSGLRCEIAPWAPLGEKYLSVTLADGSALDPSALYTVALWEGTVDEEYITESVGKYEGSFEELMSEKMRADGTVEPANDGRCTLVWSE